MSAEKKFTVFMRLPDADFDDPVYHSQVKAASYGAAFKEAIRLYCEDALKAGVYAEGEEPEISDFQHLVTVKGWPAFRLS